VVAAALATLLWPVDRAAAKAGRGSGASKVSCTHHASPVGSRSRECPRARRGGTGARAKARHAKHGGKGGHKKRRRKAKAHALPKAAPAQEAPVCEDGSTAAREGSRPYACDDGSEPTCEGSVPRLSSSGATVACVVQSGAPTGSEPSCEDGTAPVRARDGSLSCDDGSEPICEDGLPPALSGSPSTPVCEGGQDGSGGEEPACEDGSVPLPDGEGSYICEDGSEPICADGVPVVGADGSLACGPGPSATRREEGAHGLAGVSGQAAIAS
jgi:hypothetical protein